MKDLCFECQGEFFESPPESNASEVAKIQRRFRVCEGCAKARLRTRKNYQRNWARRTG